MNDAKRSEPQTLAGGEACSLPPEDRRERLAMIRREILPRATRRQALPDGLALDFEPGAATERELEELVAFERRCCSGLEWSLERSPERLRLRVSGLAPDSPLLRLADE